MKKTDLSKHFIDVRDFEVTSNGKHAITLCHYPLLTWKHRAKSYLIHSHLHNDTSEDFFPLLCKHERVLNAGVDINGFTPVSLEELIENNNRFKSEFLSKEAE